jgi:hypothetical protein
MVAFSMVLAGCRTSWMDPGCGGGGTATMERALPTLWAYCTQVCHPGGGGGTLERALPTLHAYCTQMCHPGGGGGTPVMAVPTQWAFCTQVCGPSFLGMGCGTGGTLQMGASVFHQCVPPSIADNSCPK